MLIMARKIPIHPNAAEIGDRIAAARDRLNLTNAELGKRLGMEESSVKKLVTGEACGMYARLVRVAGALETTPNQLLGVGSSGALDVESVRLAFEVALSALSVPEVRARLVTESALSALQAPPLALHDQKASVRARLAVELEQAVRTKPS